MFAEFNIRYDGWVNTFTLSYANGECNLRLIEDGGPPSDAQAGLEVMRKIFIHLHEWRVEIQHFMRHRDKKHHFPYAIDAISLKNVPLRPGLSREIDSLNHLILTDYRQVVRFLIGISERRLYCPVDVEDI